ncbi:MAG: hypothetical protein O9327_10870, partial [Polaromonas sp.]|nr:hypothetical protein [Polaromonas sp.]
RMRSRTLAEAIGGLSADGAAEAVAFRRMANPFRKSKKRVDTLQISSAYSRTSKTDRSVAF